jgi:hypothetical protein
MLFILLGWRCLPGRRAGATCETGICVEMRAARHPPIDVRGRLRAGRSCSAGPQPWPCWSATLREPSASMMVFSQIKCPRAIPYLITMTTRINFKRCRSAICLWRNLLHGFANQLAYDPNRSALQSIWATTRGRIIQPNCQQQRSELSWHHELVPTRFRPHYRGGRYRLDFAIPAHHHNPICDL